MLLILQITDYIQVQQCIFHHMEISLSQTIFFKGLEIQMKAEYSLQIQNLTIMIIALLYLITIQSKKFEMLNLELSTLLNFMTLILTLTL